MTIKEAILQCLEDIKSPSNHIDIYKHMVEKNYYKFEVAKTPAATISAQLGDFIRNSDSRVKRIKQNGGSYLYYLTKNEEHIDFALLSGDHEAPVEKTETIEKPNFYSERDLHKLLSTYLKNTEIFSKTIFHEQSNGKDSNQIWTHPDMVGIKFLSLQSKVSQNFLKSIDRVSAFKMSSYELKREINSDSDLKKAYFQAVSNSSWANYGYLVALEISANLNEEMSRLNQSFGIGIIELNANPYRSQILYPASFKELDIKTIDKLCRINKDFERFIEQIEKLMSASDKYFSGAEKELEEFCDDYFKNDDEFERYCHEKNIPSKKE